MTPITPIIACSDHQPDETFGVQTGPEISETGADIIERTLMCWRCWESDERGILRFCEALGVPADDVAAVRTLAFSRKPGLN